MAETAPDEMELLAAFRVELAEPDDLARERARQALLGPARRSARPSIGRRIGVVAASAAVVGTIAIGAAALADHAGPPAPAGPVLSPALVQVERPAIPFRMGFLPPQLKGPRVVLDAGRHTFEFVDPWDGSVLTVTVADTPSTSGPARPTTVDGRPATVRPTGVGLALEWERTPGRWVAVAGTLALADEGVLRSVAGGIVDDPQPAPMWLAVAPRGWALVDYTYGDFLRLEGSTGSMSVFRMPAFDPHRPGGIDGAGPVTTTEIDGRRAMLVEDGDAVDVQVEMPDGSAVVLNASSQLTDEELLDVAANVRLANG